MRVNRITRVGIALAMCALTQAVCHSSDENKAYVLGIETNVGTGYNCGRVSSPLYCYGIPVKVGTTAAGSGSLWLDTYTSGYNAGKGFVVFYHVADLGQATVTSNVKTLNSLNQITKLVVNLKGTTNDGDKGAYIGTMTLTFKYYYSSGGGGRGGGGAGWRFICTGGALKITYQ